MLALGLNIVVGYAGLLDLGYVAFYALGAYTVGWFASSRFTGVDIHFGSNAPRLHPRHPPRLLAGPAARRARRGARGRDHRLADAAPARRLPRDRDARLRRDHPGRVPQRRLAAAYPDGARGAAVHRLHHGNLTNGVAASRGSTARASASADDWTGGVAARRASASSDLKPWFFTIVILVLITIFVNSRLRDSKMGRAWIAVREDEVAASAMGVPLMRTKLWAYGDRRRVRRRRRRLLRLVHRLRLPDELLLQHLGARCSAWSSSAAWGTSPG